MGVSPNRRGRHTLPQTTQRQCHAVPVKAARWPLVLAALIGAALTGGCASVQRTGPSSSPSTTAATTNPIVPSQRAVTAPVSVSGSNSSPPLEEVSCTSVVVCVAVGAFGFGTPGHEVAALSTDGGAHWAVSRPPEGVTHLDALTCASPDSCLAVGDNLVGNSTVGVAVSTIDAGRTWKTVSTLPKGVGELKGISCPTPTLCMVVGSSTNQGRGITLTTDASGSQWHALSLPYGETLPSLVACTSARTCLVEGAKEAVAGEPSSGEDLSILTTVNGGTSWTPSVPPSEALPGWPQYRGLTCPAATRCLLVGDATPGDGTPSGVTAASADDGVTWTAVPPPSGTMFLNAIACPTALSCVVVGGGIEARGGSTQDILTSSDGGHTWTPRSVPAPVTGLSAVSCPTALACVAVGFGPSNANVPGVQPVVAVTDDGGASWAMPG